MSLKKPHMIDIETLSTRHDALVLSIGAVPFDTVKNTANKPWVGDPLLLVPSLTEQLLAGRRVDQETQKWWEKQPAETRMHWSLAAPLEVRAALVMLQEKVCNATEIWARGPQFDITILETLFHDVKMTVPWTYNIVRDSRTALLVKKPLTLRCESARPEGLVAHHPVDDAINEVWSLWDAEIHIG